MRTLCVLAAVLWSATVAAQPAPLVGTTVRTTSTASNSLRVGCSETAVSCTGGVLAGPVDVASVTSGGFIGIANNVPGVTTFRLYNNAGTLTWNGVALATGASLSGTTNTIPVFTGTNSVGDSIITQNGGATLITVTGALTATGALTGTLATASQPNVTTMAGLTTAGALATVGTITSGTWSGTIITLARGGTGVSLSGTGGTSQFLRQNTVGGTISVVRPAISDLSDNTNLPLLNTSNTFSRATATSNELNLTNTTSGTGAFAVMNMTAGTGVGMLTTYSQGFTTTGGAIASGTRLANLTGGGISLVSGASGGAIGFYTNGNTSLRWSIDQNGNWLRAGNLADSITAPTAGSNCGSTATVSGTNYAFVVTTNGSGIASTCTVSFNATYASAPICNFTSNTGGRIFAITPSTTQVAVVGITSNTGAPAAFGSGEIFYGQCRGF